MYPCIGPNEKPENPPPPFPGSDEALTATGEIMRIDARLEFCERCARLASRFALYDGDEEGIGPASLNALACALRQWKELRQSNADRIQNSSPEALEEVRILALREFLKRIGAQMINEHEEQESLAKELINLKQTSVRMVKRELSPRRGVPDEGSYLDPECWNPGWIAKAMPPVVRLVVFLEAMAEQEIGMFRAGATVVDAAYLAVLKRGTGNHWSQPK